MNDCEEGHFCNQVFDNTSGKHRVEHALKRFTSPLSLILSHRLEQHSWSAMAAIPYLIRTLIHSDLLCFWTNLHLLLSDVPPTTHSLCEMFVKDLKNAQKMVQETFDGRDSIDYHCRKTQLVSNLSVLKHVHDTLVESLLEKVK